MNTTDKTPIELELEIDENGMTTARQLYEFLEMDKSNFSRWARQNIEKNEFYEENKDWWGFVIMTNGNECKDYKLTTDFAKHLSMESHSAKGKEARNYFVTVKNKAKQTVLELSNLSPELRLLINVEMKKEEQEKKIDSVKEEIQGIKDVITLSPSNWRKGTSTIITRIAQKLGGNEYIQTVRKESYKHLKERAHVALGIRLSNKRKTMAEMEVHKSKRDKLNKLDIIEEDPKVLECYLVIVKEMAIKYGVTASSEGGLKK